MKKIKNFIIKQQDDIAAYGIDELFKKIIILFKIIFLIPVHIFAFFPLIIIRFLRPLIVIRIGRIPTINYGHLAYDPSVYYCKKKLKISHFEKKVIGSASKLLTN